MARRALSPASLAVAKAVESALPEGDVVVGCSGGADSTALALGAAWAATRRATSARIIVVDHGLQPGSGATADLVVARLAAHDVRAEVVGVAVRNEGEGLEAAARRVRLAVLAEPGLPVLLGHTLDDQAETVLLGLLRGSGTRSLAGMAPVRWPFIRPLLGLRRAETEAACAGWGIEWWSDPMNVDPAFARVRARRALSVLATTLGRDVSPALARGAAAARADADLLDAIARDSALGVEPPCGALSQLPDAIRWRVLRDWLVAEIGAPEQAHILAVDALVMRWHGQGPIAVPGGVVVRDEGRLRATRHATQPEQR